MHNYIRWKMSSSIHANSCVSTSSLVCSSHWNVKCSHCVAALEIVGLTIKHHLLQWLTDIHKSFLIHLACTIVWRFFSTRFYQSIWASPNGNYIYSFSYELFSFSFAFVCLHQWNLCIWLCVCVPLVVLFSAWLLMCVLLLLLAYMRINSL